MNCTKSRRDKAYELKLKHRGPEVYFRGLIEISNICRKNCLYCGIRRGNCNVERYEMSDAQVLQEAQFALDAGYGSIAIQGGERTDSAFIERITRLIYAIRRLQPGGNPLDAVPHRRGGDAPVVPGGENNLGITLSLGEQEREVYREWKNAGATRYLLRIEASNRELYEKLHPGYGAAEEGMDSFQENTVTPDNCRELQNCAGVQNCGDSQTCSKSQICREARMHSYDARVQALHDLKSEGYLLGSGIMIGLPFQTRKNLDEDLQFLKDLQVDMVGMGPYIPHKDTPLGQIVSSWRSGDPSLTDTLPPHFKELAVLPRGDFWNLTNGELLELSIDMVARLRILMPHINIAATTALQVLHPYGREMALLAGANVIMPNMTETSLRGNYSLYEGKHGVEDDAASTRDKLLDNLSRMGIPVGWNLRGDWR
ncbi:MAG: radical SAM protein [Bacteroidales bacterium]|nr:radical SAM protein [Bacteroidales bacterium]